MSTTIIVSLVLLVIALVFAIVADIADRKYVEICAKSYTIKEGQEKGKPYVILYDACAIIAIILAAIGVALGVYSTAILFTACSPTVSIDI